MNGDFQNPQQEPGTEKRLLLVFVLTFAVLIIAQPLLNRFVKPQPSAPAKQEQQQQQPVAAPSQPSTPVATPSRGAANVTSTPAAPSKQATAEQEIGRGSCREREEMS